VSVRAGRVAPSSSNGPALSKRSASNGFTIVEVMMAAVILVVGFIGMISAITVGSEMLATARRQTLATQIIHHEFEKLRLSSWSTISAPLATISATNYTSLTPDDTQFDTVITASGATFNFSRTVTNVTSDLYEVTLTVTWSKSGTTTAATTATGSWLSQLAFSRNSPISRTYTRTASAYFGKYGLGNSLQRL
jgi:Tfp pilus assembly protein PilV